MPWQSNTRLSMARTLIALLLLLTSACTTVPVDHDQPSATARLETQQKMFNQGKALFLDQQYAQAANIFLLLARQGHTDAQYTLGYMYHYGYGVPRNEKESIRWITVAAARGNTLAQKALEKINSSRDQHSAPAIQTPEP